MKLNIDSIETAIYNWIKREVRDEVDADSVFFMEQSAPLPPRPCVGIKMLTGPMRTGSFDDEIYDVDLDLLEVSGQRTMNYTIKVFGNLRVMRPMAKQLAADLSASLTKPSVLQDLYAAGVAIFEIGDITEISAIEESEYEERMQFDIKIGVAENVEDQPGCFTDVDTIQGTYLKQ